MLFLIGSGDERLGEIHQLAAHEALGYTGPVFRGLGVRPWFPVFVLAVVTGCRHVGAGRETNEPVRVGILHSLTGTMAFSEKPVVQATLLAIEQINSKGGVLGRRIEPVVVDGASDAEVFVRESERLITQERVAVLFGCWTSASLRSVTAVVEKHRHLLFYPVQSEGLAQSPNVVYTGAVANQQMIPAVKWSFDHLGKRFFLAGSDYIFPRLAGAIMKDQIFALGGHVVGEHYIPLGSRDVASLVQNMILARPNVILNMINGDSNIAFFEAVRRAGISPQRIPVVSVSLAENELQQLGAAAVAGDYAVWNYFQSIDTEENAAFIRSFRDKYGPDRVLSDPMEAAFFGVQLWAQAVEQAVSAAASAVLEAIPHQSYAAPEGLVYVDRATRHTWKTVRVGRVRADGQFDVVWSSRWPVRPVPYPHSRSRAEWEALVEQFYLGWGKQWARPVGSPAN